MSADLLLQNETPQYYGTGPGFPSSTNVFVPNLESSGRIIVGYSRNAKDFLLPRYIKYVESEQSVGLFMKLSLQEAARVVNPQDYEWADGQPRPTHDDGLEQFNLIEFRTHRYDYGFNVGWMTKNQAEWPIVEQHSQIHAAQCMTARTVRMLTVATTASNWQTSADPDMASNHTNTAATLAGGQFDKGTSTVPYIKIGLDKIAVQIAQDTLYKVQPNQLHVIINPNQARLWAESAEVHEFIKGSYWAKEELNDGLHPNNQFGLPSKIYGYDLVVEGTVQVTTRKGATLTKQFAMPDQNVLVVARPGELEGVYGAPNFSALTLFWYADEMTVETFDDPKNRLTEGHVVENTAEVVTSPLAGYLVTSSTSVAS